MKVTLATSAQADLREILAYYEELHVGEVGRRVVADLLAAVERLSDYPESGRVVPEFGVAFLREVIVPPFRIVHRRDDDHVRVVRVWRSERLLELPD